MTRSLAASLLLLSSLLSSGCYRQASCSVVVQSPAALVAHHPQVFLAPLQMDRMRVEGRPEAEWLSAQSDRQRRIYAGDRALFARQYHDRLAATLARAGYAVAAQPTPGALTVIASVTDYTPGFWAFVGKDAKIALEVQLGEDGTPLDTISVADRVKADLWSTSTTNRAERLAKAVADVTARYVQERDSLQARRSSDD